MQSVGKEQQCHDAANRSEDNEEEIKFPANFSKCGRCGLAPDDLCKAQHTQAKRVTLGTQMCWPDLADVEIGWAVEEEAIRNDVEIGHGDRSPKRAFVATFQVLCLESSFDNETESADEESQSDEAITRNAINKGHCDDIEDECAGSPAGQEEEHVQCPKSKASVYQRSIVYEAVNCRLRP